jgi:hypothetical protein
MCGMTSYDEGAYILTLYHSTGSITYQFLAADTSRVKAWDWLMQENRPRTLTITLDNADPTPIVNLLNPSCAQWSGGVTGALQEGDFISFQLVSTGNLATYQDAFYGRIVTLNPQTNGELIIIANDGLQQLENARGYKICYTSYRDLIVKEHADGDSIRALNGVTDSPIILPLAWVGFATTDIRVTIGDRVGGDPIEGVHLENPDYRVAQPFIADGDGLIGVYFTLDAWAAGPAGHIICEVQSDNGNNQPSGVALASVLTDIPWNVLTNIQMNFTVASDAHHIGTSANMPVQLAKGQRYWVVWRVDITPIPTGYILVCEKTPISAFYTTYDYSTDSGLNYTVIPTKVVACKIDIADYTQIDAKKIVYDAANTRVILLDQKDPIATVDSYYTIYRGKLSYYYNYRYHFTVMEELIKNGTYLKSEQSSNQTRTFGTYATRGKTMGDCVRELCDLFETSGPWSGSQHVIATYKDSNGDIVCKTGRRQNIAVDSSARTFSFVDDASSDDEVRITGKGIDDLKKTIKVRPAKVIVVGKDASGYPIIAECHDYARPGGLGGLMPGYTEVQIITDDNIDNLVDANALAYSQLDSIVRNQWEGPIVVSGCFPDLFDLISTSATFGSGKIITLKYSPAGINGLFKVRAVECKSDMTTRITISNYDPITLNRITKGWGASDKHESFLSTVGLADNVFVDPFYNGVISASSAWMEFDDEYGIVLPGTSRVKCTVFSNTDYNQKKFHAEFEMMNGHSTDGHPVSYVSLYTAQIGGSLIKSFNLYQPFGTNIYFDQRFAKWKSTRCIIELSCKIA